MKRTLIRLAVFCLTLGFMQHLQSCPVTITNTGKKKLFYTTQNHGKALEKRDVQDLKRKKKGFMVKSKGEKMIGVKEPNQEVFIYKHDPKKEMWMLVHSVKENFCVGHAKINYSSIEAEKIPHARKNPDTGEDENRYDVIFYDPTDVADE